MKVEIAIDLGPLGKQVNVKESFPDESKIPKKTKSKPEVKQELDDIELRVMNKEDLEPSEKNILAGELVSKVENMLGRGKTGEIKDFLSRTKYMLEPEWKEMIRDLVQSKYSKK